MHEALETTSIFGLYSFGSSGVQNVSLTANYAYHTTHLAIHAHHNRLGILTRRRNDDLPRSMLTLDVFTRPFDGRKLARTLNDVLCPRGLPIDQFRVPFGEQADAPTAKDEEFIDDGEVRGVAAGTVS